MIKALLNSLCEKLSPLVSQRGGFVDASRCSLSDDEFVVPVTPSVYSRYSADEVIDALTKEMVRLYDQDGSEPVSIGFEAHIRVQDHETPELAMRRALSVGSIDSRPVIINGAEHVGDGVIKLDGTFVDKLVRREVESVYFPSPANLGCHG